MTVTQGNLSNKKLKKATKLKTQAIFVNVNVKNSVWIKFSSLTPKIFLYAMVLRVRFDSSIFDNRLEKRVSIAGLYVIEACTVARRDVKSVLFVVFAVRRYRTGAAQPGYLSLDEYEHTRTSLSE